MLVGARPRVVARLRGLGSASGKRPGADAQTLQAAPAALPHAVPQTPVASAASANAPHKVPKRRYALLLAYEGSAYHGLQLNKEFASVEGELVRALTATGTSRCENLEELQQKTGWNRASRTDKGVHASGQVISLKLRIGDDAESVASFVRRVNAQLPASLTLFDCVRTRKHFNGKNDCDGRTYEYLLPLYVLAPQAAAQAVYEESLSLLGELGLVEGSSGAAEQPSAPRLDASQLDAPFLDAPRLDATLLGATLQPDAAEPQASQPHTSQPGAPQLSAPQPPGFPPKASLWPRHVVERARPRIERAVSGSSAADALISRLDRALGFFVGTHNFHNFTDRIAAEDPAAKRTLRVCKVDGVTHAADTGQPLVRIVVSGQSFMLHQVRKIISCAVEVARRDLPPRETIAGLLNAGASHFVPLMPAAGLLLRAPMYTVYNRRFAYELGAGQERGPDRQVEEERDEEDGESGLEAAPRGHRAADGAAGRHTMVSAPAFPPPGMRYPPIDFESGELGNKARDFRERVIYPKIAHLADAEDVFLRYVLAEAASPFPRPARDKRVDYASYELKKKESRARR
jgi:tRNA pseudouridine(38-40) synthase